MSIKKNQKPVQASLASPELRVVAVNESLKIDQLKSVSSKRHGASDENDTFTAFFPVVDGKGNVVVGKLEGPRAEVIAAMKNRSVR